MKKEELRLPTLTEVDDKEREYRRYVIDKNVRSVVEAMPKSKWRNGSFRGSVNLYGTQDTISTYENIRDCILGELEELENASSWSFKVVNGELFWSSHGFPPDKPWWRFWE